LGVSRVLLEHWDPLWLRECGVPDDEYTHEADRIAEALRTGATQESLAAALKSAIRWDRAAGAQPDAEREARGARAVLAWYARVAP
jgi:hypothetical protein